MQLFTRDHYLKCRVCGHVWPMSLTSSWLVHPSIAHTARWTENQHVADRILFLYCYNFTIFFSSCGETGFFGPCMKMLCSGMRLLICFHLSKMIEPHDNLKLKIAKDGCKSGFRVASCVASLSRLHSSPNEPHAWSRNPPYLQIWWAFLTRIKPDEHPLKGNDA